MWKSLSTFGHCGERIGLQSIVRKAVLFGFSLGVTRIDRLGTSTSEGQHRSDVLETKSGCVLTIVFFLGMDQMQIGYTV